MVKTWDIRGGLNQVCNPFSAPMSSAISSCGTRVATMLTPGRARKGLGWVNDSDLTATEPCCHGLIARNHPQMVLFHIDYIMIYPNAL